MAVNRTVNNIWHIQKRRADKGRWEAGREHISCGHWSLYWVQILFVLPSNSASGLPIDTVRWDLCKLPIRTSSVDIIITDMPFGKRYRQNNAVHCKTCLLKQLADVWLTWMFHLHLPAHPHDKDLPRCFSEWARGRKTGTCTPPVWEKWPVWADLAQERRSYWPRIRNAFPRYMCWCRELIYHGLLSGK